MHIETPNSRAHGIPWMGILQGTALPLAVQIVTDVVLGHLNMNL